MTGWEPDYCHEEIEVYEAQIVFALQQAESGVTVAESAASSASVKRRFMRGRRSTAGSGSSSRGVCDNWIAQFSRGENRLSVTIEIAGPPSNYHAWQVARGGVLKNDYTRHS